MASTETPIIESTHIIPMCAYGSTRKRNCKSNFNVGRISVTDNSSHIIGNVEPLNLFNLLLYNDEPTNKFNCTLADTRIGTPQSYKQIS